MTESEYAAKCAALMKLKLDNNFFGFYEIEKMPYEPNACNGRLCLADECDVRTPIDIAELTNGNKNA